jgi:hypothetical protein
MLYAGLDLSRKRLDFHLLDAEGATVDVGAAPPDADGLRGLSQRLEPQYEFLDFGGTRLSETSFSRDDAKAALLEDAVRRDVVVGDARVERARPINGQERVERDGRDPLAQ